MTVTPASRVYGAETGLKASASDIAAGKASEVAVSTLTGLSSATATFAFSAEAGIGAKEKTAAAAATIMDCLTGPWRRVARQSRAFDSMRVISFAIIGTRFLSLDLVETPACARSQKSLKGSGPHPEGQEQSSPRSGAC